MEEKIKNQIKNSSNPKKKKQSMELAFKSRVADGRIVILPGGGFTGSKESQEGTEKIFGTRDNPSKFSKGLAKKINRDSERKEKVTARGLAGSEFGFNPSGKKKGGSVKTSKYSKGGGVRATNYKI